MRTNTKESKLFAFICKKIKVSGKFHEIPQISAQLIPGINFHDVPQCLGSLSGSIRRNSLLKSLSKFGPFFRISFDLTLSSFRSGQDGLSNILSFIPSGQSPVLQVNVNNVGRLDFGLGKNFQFSLCDMLIAFQMKLHPLDANDCLSF